MQHLFLRCVPKLIVSFAMLQLLAGVSHGSLVVRVLA